MAEGSGRCVGLGDALYGHGALSEAHLDHTATRQAIEAARAAGKEFAEASGARLGPIRRANQGVIGVLARDETPDAAEWRSREKRLRAVATVEYLLVD